MSETSNRLDSNLIDELRHVHFGIRVRIDNELSSIGLTTRQYAVLNLLERYPRESNAELSRKCYVTPQTMNAIVQSLIGKGMLERKQAAKGRVQNLTITDEGIVKLQEARVIVRSAEKALFKKLSDPEKETLMSLLGEIDLS